MKWRVLQLSQLTPRRPARRAPVDQRARSGNYEQVIGDDRGVRGIKHRIVGQATLALLAGTTVICALAIAAPPALAQANPFSATYTLKFVNSQGGPRCSDEAAGCGTGTAAGLGAFATELAPSFSCDCVVTTLTFSDGSTLVIDENSLSSTNPGGSGSSNAGPRSAGHPGTYIYSWTVVGGTGSFAEATGSGTDALSAAGLQASGTLGGTITTS